VNPSEKLRKLLSLAARAGTPEEAATAAAMAVQLAQKHQLDIEVEEADASPVHRLCVPGRNRWRWRTSLWGVLGPVHGCLPLVGRQGFYAAGRPHDIDTLIAVYEHLSYQIRAVMRAQSVPQTGRVSFGLGCVDAISAQLKKMSSPSSDVAAASSAKAELPDAVDSTALVRVLSTRAEEARAYAQTVFALTKSAPKRVPVEREFYAAGFDAGTKMPLNPQKAIS
jgi:hypothetical protein